MLNTNVRKKLVNEVKRLVDEGFTEIDIKVINKGYTINPTKKYLSNKSKTK